MRSLFVAIAVVVLFGYCGMGCADDGNAHRCTPGEQKECPCPHGIQGAQACLEDGSGYGPCQGCDESSTSSTSSSGSGGMGGMGGGDTGGASSSSSMGSGGLGGLGGIGGFGGAPIGVTSSTGSGGMAGMAGMGGQGTGGAGTCTQNTDCADGNPCSDDLCNSSTGMCVNTNIDGTLTPGVMQVVGDCKVHTCIDGVDTEVIDDDDVIDDQNPCTADVCTGGMPSHPGITAGTPCTAGDTMVCDGNGVCVECILPQHCVNIAETECEKRACVNNACQIAYEGNGTLASPVLQTNHDCKKVVCNGNLGTTTLPDDNDLPVDGNPCTKDLCANGVPSNPPEMVNTACGAGMYCNGSGQCVGCNVASQCMGTDDFCKQRTCNNNMCGFTYAPNGTDLPTGQTTGDCKVRECDGMGNIKTSVLVTDVPVDGNPCTQDLCSPMGTPSNPPTMINSPCNVNGGDACDGIGNCKKSLGNTCGAGTECVSTFCVDGVCCNSTCGTLCMACNVTGTLGTCTAVPRGTDDGTCTGPTQSCNAANDCDDENGQTCALNSSCLSNFCVDGFCCDQACSGTCQSCAMSSTGAMNGTCANIPAGTDPNNECTFDCNGAGMCSP